MCKFSIVMRKKVGWQKVVWLWIVVDGGSELSSRAVLNYSRRELVCKSEIERNGAVHSKIPFK
jgi:hypothetical protein